MGIAVSILVIAVGAVLTRGVTAEAEGHDVNAIGVILLIVGDPGPRPLDDLLVELGLRCPAPPAYVEGRPRAPSHAGAPRATTTVVEEDEIVAGPRRPPPQLIR